MALLFVYGESGSVGDHQFNGTNLLIVRETDLTLLIDWYDNEHAPLRLTVPGIRSAARYRAIDGQTPSWLAIYDLDSPNVATSAPYVSLGQTASPREKALIPQLAMLHRRIYEAKEPLTVAPTAAKYVVISTNHDDHPDASRSRHFTLVSSLELTGKGEEQPTPADLTIRDHCVPPTASGDAKIRIFELYREFK